MPVKELYERALRAKKPIEFFGKVSCKEDLQKLYRDYAKQVYPDNVPEKYLYIANQTFLIFKRLYDLGLKELEEGTYEIYTPIAAHKLASLFEITTSQNSYRFYENVFEGEVAYIFKGATPNDIAYLKMAIDPADNHLIENEYNVLSEMRHLSLPYVEQLIQVNGSKAIIMREVKGIPMLQLMKQYPNGVPAEHVMWMLERILSVVGYIHSNSVVHGNIKPENIIIDKETHNVSIVGFSFCIPKANTFDAKYKIINDYYTAPEVNSSAIVLPTSDIYSVGKVAIELLGGDATTGQIPNFVDYRIRNFVKVLANEDVLSRPKDAWELWSSLITLRTKVFGTERFKKFD